VLPAKAVFHFRLVGKGPGRVWTGKPVRSFPTVLHTETGALGAERVVQWSLAQAASSFHFAVGPGHLVMQAKHLGDALAEERSIVRPRREAADIDGPQVQGGLAFEHPFGEIFSGAARAGDAHGVE